MATTEEIRQALAAITDPVLDKTLGELDLVGDIRVDGGEVTIALRVPIPDRSHADELTALAEQSVTALPDVTSVTVDPTVVDDEQRSRIAERLRGDRPAGSSGNEPAIPFAQLDSKTKVFAVASGKGGVGKSSITANLAAALARDGYRVGVLDADIWGYSIPRMMGASGRPIAFADLVLPLRAHGCKVISIGFFVDAERPVIWRGPMLHRALQQFLADVHWGDLDFLFCDLPPGTGDIAISLAQMLPNADMLVVTTPQQAAQKVALRAGQTTAQTGMRVAGVIENMATFVAPDTGKEYRIFGEGGGELLASELDTRFFGSIPIDARLREGADEGLPLVIGDPDAPASKVLTEIAGELTRAKSSMAGKSLPLQG